MPPQAHFAEPKAPHRQIGTKCLIAIQSMYIEQQSTPNHFMGKYKFYLFITTP
jgi:hypothetical protein